LSPTNDSGLLVFSAIPRYASKYGRIYVFVKSKTSDGYVVTFGSGSTGSKIKGRSIQVLAQDLWTVLSVPFAIVAESRDKPQRGVTAEALKPEDYNNRGVTFKNLGQSPQQTIADFDEAIRLDPIDAIYYNNRGQSYVAIKQYERAIADFDQVMRLDPAYAQAYNNRGQSYLALGQPERSIADFNQAIQLDPTNAVAFTNRGRCYSALREYDKAISDYNEAIELYSMSQTQEGNELSQSIAVVWNSLGIALRFLGRIEQAESSFAKAISTDPTTVWYYINQADLLLERHRYSDALTVIDLVVSRIPDRSIAWAHRGQILRRLGRYEDAIASYDHATELDPQYAWAWNGKGLAFAATGDWLNAKKCYGEALAHNPDDVWVWHNYGEAVFQTGDLNEAITAYEQALQRFPNNQSIIQKLRELQD
jgi:tetratricopeptide (TPR) repeat protein